MENNSNYDPDSIIGQYINACKTADQSLSQGQINMLEQTVNDAFGIKKLPAPSYDTFKPLDENAFEEALWQTDSQSGRIMKVLEQYRQNNTTLSTKLPVSEADAWSLYSLTAEEIQKTTYKDLKQKHNLPETYGWSSFRMLHEYFTHRGILEENARFPRPLKAKDANI